jgi:hypothetical protein
LKNTQI